MAYPQVTRPFASTPSPVPLYTIAPTRSEIRIYPETPPPPFPVPLYEPPTDDPLTPRFTPGQTTRPWYDTIMNAAADPSQSATPLPRFRFEHQGHPVYHLQNEQIRHNPSRYNFIPADSITFRDPRDLEVNARAQYMLENLAIICMSARDPISHEIFSRPPHIAESTSVLSALPQRVALINNETEMRSLQIVDHRTIFHGSLTVYNDYEKRLSWKCEFSLCHANCLRSRTDPQTLLNKQPTILHQLDLYADILPSCLTVPQLLHSATVLTQDRRNIFCHELRQKYSHILAVIDDAFENEDVNRLLTRMKKQMLSSN